ncbi:ArsR/SmtB family transcription factor [Tomitella cavernea]|uniref:HTH arsR-type domain-containing protein n=1 Tax=Tomitella cavernea TaxID=1387982 RepID=A0ABP9CRA0_9ACTN|nr:helix-turn-helix transcriptional regulator [Tomitella cavernea]
MVGGTDLQHPARDEIDLGDVLFALSAPDRLSIVLQLQQGPLTAARCTADGGPVPKSTKSHMLKVLRESGVIRNEPRGRNRVLTLRRVDLDARFPGLLDAVLGAGAAAATSAVGRSGANLDR